MDGNDAHMDTREPIYRKICLDRDRPALTLDHSGGAYGAEHADVFIAVEGNPGGVTRRKSSHC